MGPGALTGELQMAEYLVSKAETADAALISAIEQECFSLPLTAEQVAAQIDDEKYLILCVRSDSGEILGYAGMYYVLDEGYITNVAVTAASRRNHLADALILKLLEISDTLELAFVTLEVRESNLPAKSLYRKHGFEEVGLRKNYYQAPHENAVIMTKYLSEEKN